MSVRFTRSYMKGLGAKYTQDLGDKFRSKLSDHLKKSWFASPKMVGLAQKGATGIGRGNFGVEVNLNPWLEETKPHVKVKFFIWSAQT